MGVLIQLMWDICEEPIRNDHISPSTEDDMAIVADAMALLVASLLHNPELLPNFYNYSNSDLVLLGHHHHSGGSGGEGEKEVVVVVNSNNNSNGGNNNNNGDGVGGRIYDKERGRIEELIVNLVMNHPEERIRQTATNGFLSLCALLGDW